MACEVSLKCPTTSIDNISLFDKQEITENLSSISLNVEKGFRGYFGTLRCLYGHVQGGPDCARVVSLLLPEEEANTNYLILSVHEKKEKKTI